MKILLLALSLSFMASAKTQVKETSYFCDPEVMTDDCHHL